MFCISLFVQTACAQDAKQVVKLVESQRDMYYYGHGYAEEYGDAVNKAKAQLVNDISTFVSSSMYGTISNDGVTMEERISTYSNMVQLREVTTIVVAESPTFHVFCYTTKETVNNMFEERKAKMNNYFNEGVKAESKLHITDALQNYYWALLILRTLPDDDKIIFTDDKGEKQNMLLWLNKHIRDVVDNVNFKIGGVSGSDTWRVLDVLVSYHDKPVVNCDYKYWTGMGYSQVVRAKNGHGVAEFQQVPEKVTFYVEYSFENEANNVDPELRDIMQKSEKPSFKNSLIVSTGAAAKSAATAASGTKPSQGTKGTLAESSQNAFKGAANDNASAFFSKPSAGRADSCTTIMNAVKNAVRTKDYSSIQHLFTQEGWKLFHQMFTTGKTTIVRDDQPVFLQTPKKIICRSLHMSFFYPRSSKTIVEDVEFELNLPDLKISSVAFTLNSEAESDIMDDNKKWSDVSRYQLVHFLQNYQTAYATKRT